MWIVEYSEYRQGEKRMVKRYFIWEDEAREFVTNNAMVHPLPDCSVYREAASDEPPF